MTWCQALSSNRTSLGLIRVSKFPVPSATLNATAPSIMETVMWSFPLPEAFFNTSDNQIFVIFLKGGWGWWRTNINCMYYLLLRLVLTSVKKKAIGLSRLEVKRNFIVGRKNRFKAFLSQVISDILSAADSDFNGRFGWKGNKLIQFSLFQRLCAASNFVSRF